MSALDFAPDVFRIGLNPYGIASTRQVCLRRLERRNPAPLGLAVWVFAARGEHTGAAGVLELAVRALLKDVADADVESICARLHRPDHYAILMHGISWGDLDGALNCAKRFRFKTIRMHLTSILSGARAAQPDWRALFEESSAALVQALVATGRRTHG